jgi:hypothetical protein
MMGNALLTIVGIILLIIIVLALSAWRFEKSFMDKADVFIASESDARPVSNDDLQDLPELLQHWLKASGSIGKPRAPHVRIHQDMELRMKPEATSWMKATALQYNRYVDPGFIWRIKMPIIWPLKVLGVDQYTKGQGSMKMTMGGLVDLGSKGPNPRINESAGQRFIGELIWYPPAALSPYLVWKEVDPQTLEVRMKDDPEVVGRVIFNGEGLPETFTAQRFYESEEDSKRYPWTCKVEGYEAFSGLKVPAECSVHWQLEAGDWEWLRLKITDLTILDPS